ncbi:MAG TPA: ABC transporter permease [Vicinamibacterales bacterium]|nr:ABC transporter permease [Vicinamibacterales bacterium]
MPRSTWIARAVLRAWPRELRDRHGRAFAQTFARSWDNARGGFGLWERASLVAEGIGAGWIERRARRRSWHWRILMRSISTECRAAWRGLRARPMSTLAVMVTLGIGLGATVAMFAVMDAVLLRPLPYPRDEQLMTLTERHATRPQSGVSFPAFQDWSAIDGIASLGAYTISNGILRAGGEPARVEGMLTSPGFFQTLGVAPALGRTPVAGDPLLDPDPKIVLGDRVWREQFGARTDVIGAVVRIDNRTYTVIGVMPAGFEYPAGSMFWTTLPENMKMLLDDRGLRFVDVVARARPGTDAAAIDARLRAWADGLRASEPKAMTGWTPSARSLRDVATGAVRQPIVVTFAGVGVLLLIACCNVAAMLLAQGRARQRALAVQAALGASRSQLIRQLLIEGLMLAAAGSAIAVTVALMVRRSIVALSLDQIPRIDLVQVDGRVVLFVGAIALLTTIVFALGPAMAVSRVDSSALMGRASRTVAGDRRRMLSGLVAAEFALALTLVAAAGLLTNSYRQLRRVDLGFQPAGVGVARVTVPLGAPWNDVDTRRRLYDDILTHARTVQGLTDAALVTRLPLEPVRGGVDVWTPGERNRAVPFVLQEVSDGYVRAIGARLIEGRDFTADDRAGGPVVAIVNDVAARHLWPGQFAIGKTVEYDFMRGRVSAEVIGVVGSVRYDGLQGAPRPELYGTFRQGLAMPASLVFRALDNPLAAVPGLRAALRNAEPTGALTLDAVSAFDDRIASQFARPRFFLALVGAFASIAFVLAALGMYGTLSFWIAERRRELGIRIALGATRASIAQLVVRRGLLLAGSGLAAGLLMTLGVSRYLRVLLFAVSPADPSTLAAAAAVLGLVAAIACWLPARRAAAVDPLEMLRD